MISSVISAMPMRFITYFVIQSVILFVWSQNQEAERPSHRPLCLKMVPVVLIT